MNEVLGVIGAGTMGEGIAHLAAASGLRVFLYDSNDGVVHRALGKIAADTRKKVSKGEMEEAEAHAIASRLTPLPSMEGVSACTVVIEAALERLDVKQAIVRQLDEYCSSETVFATNTSSLSITAIAAGSRHPHRIAGMHFFNPAQRMKLVEIVRGHHTGDAAIERLTACARTLGKTSIIVTDTPGFIVNRIARPFYGEALRILGEGVASFEEIDRIVTGGGFKMGPFELMDLIGIDINFAVTQSMYEQTFHEPRYRPHLIQKTMVTAGLLGRKTKRGFYTYDS